MKESIICAFHYEVKKIKNIFLNSIFVDVIFEFELWRYFWRRKIKQTIWKIVNLCQLTWDISSQFLTSIHKFKKNFFIEMHHGLRCHNSRCRRSASLSTTVTATEWVDDKETDSLVSQFTIQSRSNTRSTIYHGFDFISNNLIVSNKNYNLYVFE